MVIINSISYMFRSSGGHLQAFKNCKGKGKPIPLQAWTGPEDSRRLRFADFKTIGT
jgi:hypothetical protein